MSSTPFLFTPKTRKTNRPPILGQKKLAALPPVPYGPPKPEQVYRQLRSQLLTGERSWLHMNAVEKNLLYRFWTNN